MHTKGDWILIDNGNIVSKELRDKGYSDYICQMPFSTPKESEGMKEAKANAVLICAATNLLDACERILFVINKDKDGSYFICEEAKESVENLMKTIYLAKGK